MELHSITFPGLPDPYKVAPASHLDDKNNPHGVTIAQIGAAPAGYGLGEHIAMIVRDVNTATRKGWFLVEPNATNSPNSTYYVVVRTDGVDGNSVVQTAFVLDSYFSKLVRRRMFGTWGEWEWENPPMVLGVEYRTTERYYGKAVYCKAINFGALPENTSKTVAHGISNKTENVRHTITSSDTSRLLSSFGVTDVLVDDTKIQLNTATNLSYVGVIFTLWYTKD
mgnify:CR=1 FL=1